MSLHTIFQRGRKDFFFHSRFLQVLVQELGVNVDMSFIMATFDILSDLQSSKTKVSTHIHSL